MKLSIIGAGTIGATLAYKIADLNLVDEIVLVDIAKDLAVGQALDISHSLVFHSNTKVVSGEYKETASSDIVMVAAGKPRRPGIDRLDLMKDNTRIVGSVVRDVIANSPDTILMTVTNPMDVMNYVAYRESGLPRERVIGFGGELDTSRFRYILSKELKTGPVEIEAYVLGEHGESQTPIFSSVMVGGERVEFDKGRKDEIREKIRKSAMDVIERKGATVFAPITTASHMVEAIIKDSKKLIPCSVVLEGEYGKRDISIGVPAILGKNGVEKIEEWELEPYEKKIFDEGAEKLSKYCNAARITP